MEINEKPGCKNLMRGPARGIPEKVNTAAGKLRPNPPLAMKVAVSAVEVTENNVPPPPALSTVPPLLVKVPLPAVELWVDLTGAKGPRCRLYRHCW